jgi:excinuclease ABC subunit A
MKKNNLDHISIVKANVHNLDSINIKIPKNELIVVTGPSGSGKSSLAFDTIYVEGQRRYIESLSSYARQFLGQFQAPDVESISGLSPAIAIDQKTSSKNPRSTVGTVTEIYDYMRILFARVGTLYCPNSGKEIRSYTPAQISKEILKQPDRSKLFILAEVKFKNVNELSKLIGQYLSQGFNRCKINDDIFLLDEANNSLNSFKEIKSFKLVIDRILLKAGVNKRLTDSIEHALKFGNGIVYIDNEGKGSFTYSEKNMSPSTGEIFPELEPRLFSFNSPLGACPTCNGLGQSKVFSEDLVIFDPSLPTLGGAIKAISRVNQFFFRMTEVMLEEEGVKEGTPYNKLPKKIINILFNGSKKSYTYKFKSENSNFEFSKPYPGMTKWLNKKYRETGSEKVRKKLEDFMSINTCPDCHGHRLNPIALSTKIKKKNIMEISSWSIDEAYHFYAKLDFTKEKKIVGDKLLKEIRSRLKFLLDVGLGYLNLNRASMTLSGGESQRIRLATQIGSALTGVLYVLDEPSIGLHQRDNTKLIKTLKHLRDIGNTVIVVEHDEETMMEADYIIDLGPGAGIHGGNIVAHGPTKKFINNKKSLTAKYLRGDSYIETPNERLVSSDFIKIKGANQNNLEKLNVDIPLGGMVSITGVSGSGKSTLVHDVLVPACKAYLAKKDKFLYQRSNYNSIGGVGNIHSVIELTQTPIGRTPHSNPATYTGLFDEVRKLFSMTQESQIRGYKQGRFSFNVKGGRCEECEGNGVKKVEMHFLPDVYITCAECHGSRYNNETLSILYKGKNISDVLQMSIEEGRDFFKNHPKLYRILDTMFSVGLGYMKLGQPATTLSGGEAQRLKLSRELSKRTKGHCLYVLDEPTTGLHFEDIKILLLALQGLVKKGHTVLVIEHNLDIIKASDYVIDLGPEGGAGGGKVIAKGTPEEVAKTKNSFTGKYLKKCL